MTRTTSSRRTMSLLMAVLLFAASVQDSCLAFSQLPSTTKPTSSRHWKKIPSNSHGTTGTSSATAISTSTSRAMSTVVDPYLEAESLTVMAHLALDFSGFVLSPSRSLFRLAAVLGRIFAISADYVVDHSIHTEELMIQLFLITMALKEFFYPAAATAVANATATVPTNSTAETK